MIERINGNQSAFSVDLNSSPDDRTGLGYIQENGIVIGLVDPVNGPGSAECSDYHPTRHELAVLARYWMDQQLDSVTSVWLLRCIGSTDQHPAVLSTAA